MVLNIFSLYAKCMRGIFFYLYSQFTTFFEYITVLYYMLSYDMIGKYLRRKLYDFHFTLIFGYAKSIIEHRAFQWSFVPVHCTSFFLMISCWNNRYGKNGKCTQNKFPLTVPLYTLNIRDTCIENTNELKTVLDVVKSHYSIVHVHFGYSSKDFIQKVFQLFICMYYYYLWPRFMRTPGTH